MSFFLTPDKASMQSELKSVLSSCTHVITLGWWETNEVRQARVLAESSVQHLYCIPGIPDSIALDSVAEPGWSGMSGVYTRPQSYERYIDALVAVAPNVAMACIVYDPNQTVYGVDAFMSEQQQRLTAELSVEVLLLSFITGIQQICILMFYVAS